MHYYIDGYNLLFRVLHAGEDLQVQRQRIIDDLYNKIHFLELHVTLVFDSQYHHAGSSRSYKQHLEILFTAQGETADDLILDEIKKASKPEQITVITSDKKLAWLARRRAAKTETVEEFIQWLSKRYQNKWRHLKEKSKQTLPKATPTQTKPTVKKEKGHPPSSQISPEKCQDFYQEIFEKKYQEMSHQEKPSKKPPKPKKTKKSLTPPPEATAESDMERWLKAFEQKSKNDDFDIPTKT